MMEVMFQGFFIFLLIDLKYYEETKNKRQGKVQLQGEEEAAQQNLSLYL